MSRSGLRRADGFSGGRTGGACSGCPGCASAAEAGGASQTVPCSGEATAAPAFGCEVDPGWSAAGASGADSGRPSQGPTPWKVSGVIGARLTKRAHDSARQSSLLFA